METTFMTIHNLSPEANILFASDSIVDILGYSPDEVINRSCYDYFHPEEIPFAQITHDRSVRMDKAAALHYARILNRDREWVSCECVFTVVYNVLVACTSTYRGDAQTERRADEARNARRRFTSSPRDPRYHMLEHLSAKFRAPPQPPLNEPRAALILNRFTRTLTVMYATESVASILGVSAAQIKDKSFYECIQENCLPDAIRVLESAKANDSIAYLRFRYRDPRRPEDLVNEEAMHDASQSSDSEDGGVELSNRTEVDVAPTIESSSSAHPASNSQHSGQETSGDDKPVHSISPPDLDNARTDSGTNSDLGHNSINAIFDQTQGDRSSTSSIVALEGNRRVRSPRIAQAAAQPAEDIEIEAVVSCTSDGLVVIVRHARTPIPDFTEPTTANQIPHQYGNGFFAAPWGVNPIRPHIYQPNQQYPFQHGFDAPIVPPGGPPLDDFMASIREVAVFAWSLVGINGNIASYGHGIPRGEAFPPAGLPVWDPFSQPTPGYYPPENQAAERWMQRDQKRSTGMGIHSRVPPQVEYGQSGGYDGNGLGRMGSQATLGHHAQGSLGGGYVFQGPGSYVNNGYATQYSHLGNQDQQGNPAAPDNNVSEQGQRPGEDSQRNRFLWY